jgi:hypothetical protein
MGEMQWDSQRATPKTDSDGRMNMDTTVDTTLTELSDLLFADAELFRTQQQCGADDLSWLPSWFLGQLAALDAQDDALEQQFDRLRKQNHAKRRALWWRWGELFQARVHQDLQGSKKKSVDYAYGRAGVRSVPARTKLVVDDLDAASSYAMLQCPDAVKVSVSPTKLYEHIQATGEIVPGTHLETTEATESFFPKPPQKGEDDGSHQD